MKEKINIKTIGCSLMLLAILLGFSACNNEDDVMEIFNNKTWKLSRIATEKGKEQFYQGLWNNEAEEKASRELLKTDGNFTLNFNCAEVNGEVTVWWGRAAHWQFTDGVCSVFDSEQKHTEEELVMSFRVLEKEAA